MGLSQQTAWEVSDFTAPERNVENPHSPAPCLGLRTRRSPPRSLGFSGFAKVPQHFGGTESLLTRGDGFFPVCVLSEGRAVKEMEDALQRAPQPTFLLADDVVAKKRDPHGNAALLHVDVQGSFLISKPR